MIRYPVWYLLLTFTFLSCSNQSEVTFVMDRYNYLTDFEATTDDGFVNMVVEIPAGSNQKWEVDKETGHLAWEVRSDTLRVVRYLPYPANYGMVPKTWLPVSEGGDDDPMDIFLIGPAAERGSVVPARVVGVIYMKDGGEQDDKLIAVDPESWFYDIHTLDQLRENYPGIVENLTGWLSNYKGDAVEVVVEGVGDESEAAELLNKAIRFFEDSLNTD